MPSISRSSEEWSRGGGYVARPDLGRTFEAWYHLARAGEIQGQSLRLHVLRAWLRASENGCRPESMRLRRLSDEETLVLLDRESALIAGARPYMAALSRAAGDAPHAVVLSDCDGRVLDVVCDEHSVRSRHRVPGPGDLLSESVAGANGIGTPLAEGSYVELVGPEHFIAAFHSYTSQGTPLRVDGQVVGALGMWVRRLESTARVHDILVCAARGIEVELLARHLAASIQRLQPAADDDQPLEALRQDIVQLQAAARLRLEAAARLHGEGADTLELLIAAERLLQTFHQRATLWRDLVDDESGVPCAVLLHDHLDRFMDLLGTEAELRGVKMEPGPVTTVMAHVDSRALSRSLLRVFLRAFAAAGQGGRVRVTLAHDADRAAGVIRLQTSSTSAGGEQAFSLEAPAMEAGS